MTKENTKAASFLTRNTDLGEAQIAYFFHAFKESKDMNTPTIVFCGGFKSNMEGSKALFLRDFCAKNKLDYCRFDYQGHGISSGDFADGTIGDWFQDTLAIIDQVTTGPLILVGSSMGGWMSMLLTHARPERIKGLVLIAPAPDFPTKLMWPELDEAAKQDLETKGVWYRPSEFEGEESYPISMKFIEESKSHNLLDGSVEFNGPVHIIHGLEDEVVPNDHPFKVADCLTSTDITIEMVKAGDHRLSNPDELNRLGKRVLEIVSKTTT
ncbi:alpha/beta hydrolase [Curvivirga sp.]|uniref:alpha/beta hydrolase n=1 Tax=Curvivirga sp. TaxID=2856848 RepID=UPI003B5C4263